MIRVEIGSESVIFGLSLRLIFAALAPVVFLCVSNLLELDVLVLSTRRVGLWVGQSVCLVLSQHNLAAGWHLVGVYRQQRLEVIESDVSVV